MVNLFQSACAGTRHCKIRSFSGERVAATSLRHRSTARIPVTPSEKDCVIFDRDVTGRLDRAIKDLQNGNYVPNTI